MFTAIISTLTDTEIAADIATCRAVLKAGSVNGITLDSDSEGYYRDWLECAEEEQTIRADYVNDVLLNNDAEDYRRDEIDRLAEMRAA